MKRSTKNTPYELIIGKKITIFSPDEIANKLLQLVRDKPFTTFECFYRDPGGMGVVTITVDKPEWQHYEGQRIREGGPHVMHAPGND